MAEGTLKLEQREFGPYLTAQPFVAARHNAIIVPRFYAKKKKVSSGTPEESNSGQNSVSGSRCATEQPHDVTVSNNDRSNNDGIEADEIVSLKRNERGGIMREDTTDQNRVNEEIIGELNTPKETEIEEVVCNEELSLAKEFGAAKLLGSGRKANKTPNPHDISNPSARDNLSGTPSLKLSRDTDGNRVHKQKASRSTRTWTCRKRISSKNNTAAQVKLHGKKKSGCIRGTPYGSEGTLKLEQREFGPYLTAQPFVAARHNAIIVPRFYAKKKKVSSGTPEESNSGQNSVSGSRCATEQPHDVTVSNNDRSNNDGIEADEIVSLKRNERGGIMREDTTDQNRVNEEIIGELNTPKETEIEEVVCNEELSLAKEFGAAKLLGSGRKANKTPNPHDISNPSARDNLSGTPSLKLSRDTDGNRVHKQKASRSTRTWTCRKRISSKNNTAAQVKLHGKKKSGCIRGTPYGRFSKTIPSNSQ
nr:hypothetical protein CFP56_17117 [Quercus suber]